MRWWSQDPGAGGGEAAQVLCRILGLVRPRDRLLLARGLQLRHRCTELYTTRLRFPYRSKSVGSKQLSSQQIGLGRIYSNQHFLVELVSTYFGTSFPLFHGLWWVTENSFWKWERARRPFLNIVNIDVKIRELFYVSTTVLPGRGGKMRSGILHWGQRRWQEVTKKHV